MPKSVVVSFVGGADLKGQATATPNDMSPVLRLFASGGDRLRIDPRRTRLLLLDDRPDTEARRAFGQWIEQRLPGLGHDGVNVEVVPIPTRGPSDRQGLYKGVWEAIPPAASARIDQYLFHLSSGTPAMQATLMLAACCLPLPSARLFETSREKGVEEIELPYLLALRERQRRERTARRPSLNPAARRALMPNTVVEDPSVQVAYAKLYAESRTRPPRRVLIKGPTGSGKRHAAEQFSRWRNARVRECLGHEALPDTLADDEVLVARWLDAWPEQGLRALQAWCARHSGAAVIGTWRTDVFAAAGAQAVAGAGLADAVMVELPALTAREDVVSLAEALATARGIWSGKLFKRFQFEFVSDHYVRNLHDLATLLATGTDGPSRHPKRDKMASAIRHLDADAARARLRQVFEGLSGLHFGSGQPTLAERLEDIRLAVVQCAKAGGRSDREAGALLGCSQQLVSKLLGEAKQGRAPRAKVSR